MLTIVVYHALGTVTALSGLGLASQVLRDLVEAVAVVAVRAADVTGVLVHLATSAGDG
jgi:hypothetical protein